MKHWEEEALRRHDLSLNILLDDGKPMFSTHRRSPVVEIDITKQIEKIENWIINKNGRIIGRVDEQVRKYRGIS